MKHKVDYSKIYNYLKNTKQSVVSASAIANGIGIERIYGATMLKLVNDGYLRKCPAKGYYYNLYRR